MLQTISHNSLLLVTAGIRYIIQGLLFEFDLTIENLRKSARLNLVKPWLLLDSLNQKYP